MTSKLMTGPLQVKRGSAQAMANLKPAKGEPFFDVNNNVLKIGDGVQDFASLLEVNHGLNSSAIASAKAEVTKAFQAADTALGTRITQQGELTANQVSDLKSKVDLLSTMYLTDITEHPFSIDFNNDRNLILTGELDTAEGVLRF